jgi:RNA polymerase sigma-B factor
VPVEAVRRALAARGCFSPTSLEAPVLGAGGVLLRDTLVEPHSAQAYDAAEARVVLDPALARLGPTERRLLQLCFVEERSQRDIAGALGLSPSRVSRMLGSALQRLRTEIDASGRGFAGPAA